VGGARIEPDVEDVVDRFIVGEIVLVAEQALVIAR
jgi:hypothetical protein